MNLVVAWMVLKAKKKRETDDTQVLVVELNFPNEMRISATNAGVTKSERIALDGGAGLALPKPKKNRLLPAPAGSKKASKGKSKHTLAAAPRRRVKDR